MTKQTNHRFAWLITASLVLTLAACGGDKKAPAELTGVLHAGQLQGVEFATPSRHGTTDANGRFTYLPGEGVTFSLGRNTLGTVAGAPDISLFTLAGLTPPTSERTLRRELDIALRAKSPFTRAMNMDLLLIMLDADGNPANGLNVRDRLAGLAGVTLDFDLPYRAFEARLYRSVPDLTHNIPPETTVAHLYGSLDLKVAVHAVESVQRGYGPVFWLSMDSFTYFANGALATEDTDYEGDGIANWRTSYQYDALNRTRKVDYDSDTDFDGVPDRMQGSTREYDSKGDLHGVVSRSYTTDGIPTVQRLTDISFDRYGRPRRQTQELDIGDDGVVDERYLGVTEYDARGNGASSRWETDSDADGASDNISLTTYRYDSRDRLLSTRQEEDLDADGVLDALITGTYDYASQGSIDYVVETDGDADGVANSRVRYHWTQDADGNTLSSTYASEPLTSGESAYSGTVVQEYDRYRRIVHSLRRADIDGDGVTDSRNDVRSEFDDLGNERERISDMGLTDDDPLVSRTVQHFEYGDGGELLSTTFDYDWNGDGVADSHTVETVTHVLLPDGVLHLAQWYFTRRFYDGAGAVDAF